MHKFTLLFVVVLCAIALTAAEPKKQGHKKSAKLVRAGKLIAKPLKQRRSGKLCLEEVHHHEHHREHHHVDPCLAADIPAVEEEIIEEVLEDLPEEEILELAAEEIAHEIGEAVEAKEAPAHHHGAQYFNTHFGNANDGSIAVANSYSTGAKGHSQSHATSYGANHHADHAHHLLHHQV